MASGFGPTFWETVKSPPEMPGLSRPVWLTIAASVPTALGWYGYYKFSVEEELFYDELRREGRTSGFGGYVRLLLLLLPLLLPLLLLRTPAHARPAPALLGDQVTPFSQVRHPDPVLVVPDPRHPWKPLRRAGGGRIG